MGDFVLYDTAGGRMMRALVKRRHRDGSITLEPYFRQDANGNDCGAFQGCFTVRLAADNVRQLSDS
ncbi:hypothetical protein HLH33_17265 [Gluconacetobacter diazotrophicus]|uniref:Uncharacterized protein n=1 Tax=Gluconacetobacter diazotrophicus TaxID=33996 RepID=A0A7W4NHU8_GLUDI|nr:hypothetical protein [Gluconacetobacter diazotrophicus]MBB2158022.1 hypothetical protein [Gluconacetobacter diazotrophicus]